MAKKKAAKKEPLGTVGRVIEAHANGTTSVTVDIPTLTPPTPEEIAIEPEPELGEDEPPEVMIPVETAIVEMPLRGEHNTGPAHVDAQLNRQQAATLRRLQDGLRHQNEELANGRPVFSRASVVQWLLEKIGRA